MKLGLEVFLEEYCENYKNARIGLVTNSTGIDSSLRRNIDLLLEKGLKVVRLFGPEHGVFGAAPDGVKVSDFVEPRYKIPVHSLYGENLRPTPEMLKDLDIMIYDIQDVGLRFYTYIYTMAYCMEECAKQGIKFIVLDRPNPISCKIEGPAIKKDLESFVGGYNLVLRYGLTVGELAIYLNQTFQMNADLLVVPMKGYLRSLYYDETGLLWNTPSPNLPSLEHTILYAGFCLFEGVNVSVGRGTVHPFKYIGAPWIDSQRLYKEIKKFGHEGVAFRERIFVPAAFKLQNQVCNGLEFFVTDKNRIKPLSIAVDLISVLKRIHREEFSWDTYYHDETERYYFDLLLGDDLYRNAIEDGATSKDFEPLWEKAAQQFYSSSKRYYLY
ncbi:exo-beta-N-acetylmuramidase NamZ family protein [Pseudothermotoga sp. U03pept]|uniref:exo-beta-N-acetylmuramidase NamZ family protein n=1 Tax=Pseudothermotoga sp. U03pept TaxID=3447012 RepID=UPI003F10920C